MQRIDLQYRLSHEADSSYCWLRDDDYNCVYMTWFYAILFKYTTLVLSFKCEALTLALALTLLALLTSLQAEALSVFQL